MCTPPPHWRVVSTASCMTRDVNSGLCSLPPGPLTLICCNRASTLNTQHIDVLENPGGSLPFLVRGAWHAGRERRYAWHTCRVVPQAGHNQLSAKSWVFPKDRGWGVGQRCHWAYHRAKKEYVDKEGTLNSRDLVDSAVVDG